MVLSCFLFLVLILTSSHHPPCSRGRGGSGCSIYQLHGLCLIETLLLGQWSDFLLLSLLVPGYLVPGQIHTWKHSCEQPFHTVFCPLPFHMLQLRSCNSFDQSAQLLCTDLPMLLVRIFHSLRLQEFQRKVSSGILGQESRKMTDDDSWSVPPIVQVVLSSHQRTRLLLVWFQTWSRNGSRICLQTQSCKDGRMSGKREQKENKDEPSPPHKGHGWTDDRLLLPFHRVQDVS